MITDPISDLIIRIKNGSDAKKAVVAVSYSKFTENISQALKKAGYLVSVDKKKGKPIDSTLELALVYSPEGEARIHGAERISKPSRRLYLKSTDIRMFKSGFGNTFLSTPKGVLSDIDAKKLKVGGEVLFRIW